MRDKGKRRGSLGRERVYRLSRGWLITFVIGGFCALAAAFCIGWLTWLTNADEGGGSPLLRSLGYVLAFLLVGASLSCFISAFQFRVVIAGEQILVRQLFNFLEIRKQDVRGFRTTTRLPVTLILVPKDNSRTIAVPLCFESDDRFWEWIDDLPDLDDEGQLAAEDFVVNNETFGGTETSRREILLQARRADRRLSLLVLAILAWGLFYPRPYDLAMFCVAATPWLGMAFLYRYRGLIRADGPKPDTYLAVTLPVILPGIILSLRVVLGWQIVDWIDPLGFGAALATTMLVILLKLDPAIRRKIVTSFTMLVFLMPYGYSSVVLANGLWGDQPIEFVEARVVSKRISSNRHQLNLESWGSRPEEAEVEVPRALHEVTEAGDTVCVVVRTGSLGIEWFTVQRCR